MTYVVSQELSAILRKTEGVEQVLREMLLPFESRIESAFIYGSVAKNEGAAFSDIDLFVLADEVGSADFCRPANRYVVFQCLPHTLGVGTEIWRVLADAHDVRNGFEYEGSDEVAEDLVE